MNKMQFSFITRTLLLGLAILFSQASWANNDCGPKDPPKSKILIQKTNWGNTMGCTYGDSMCVSLWEDNTLEMSIQIYMSDNRVEDYPEMVVFYTFPDYFPIIFDFTAPITAAMLEELILPSGESIWRARFPFTFNFDTHCELLGRPNFPFRIEYQLVTPLGPSVYTPYPVGDHATLFSPDLFHIPSSGVADYIKKKKEICCHDETYVCSQAPIIPYAYVAPSIPIQNETKVLDQAQLRTNGNNESGPAHPWEATLAPNPFTHQTQLQLPIGTEQFTLSVYDALGSEVYHQPNTNLSGHGKIVNINTQSWPPGVYYFHYFNKKESGVLKSIKR